MEDTLWPQYARRFKPADMVLPFPLSFQPEMIVCIPAYAEPSVIRTLQSLLECDKPVTKVLVLILFNEDDRMSVSDRAIHQQSMVYVMKWIEENNQSEVKFMTLSITAPPTIKWGVGWARKTVMDTAARWCHPEGILISLDADCVVEKNYLTSIWQHFINQPACDAISIHFEHDLDNLDLELREAIISYELHLLYLVEAQRWAGHPFAYHTVGSAMAVRRKAYLEQGGMNTRQAGEDFYFLQKFIEAGRLQELNSTTVYPAVRESLRVPFGTGKAMHQMLSENKEWKTTSMETWKMIRPLFQQIPALYDLVNKKDDNLNYEILGSMLSLDARLLSYLEELDFLSECKSIGDHTASLEAFQKRFFRYFNAFRMIRYAHDMRELYFEDMGVGEALKDYYNEVVRQDQVIVGKKMDLNLNRLWQLTQLIQ